MAELWFHNWKIIVRLTFVAGAMSDLNLCWTSKTQELEEFGFIRGLESAARGVKTLGQCG